MRLSVLPPPSSQDVRSSRVHELLRDYPELAPLLEARGIDLRECGGKYFLEALPADEPVLSALMAELRWREHPGR